MTAPPIDWHDVDTEPGDHQPTPFDCRQHEMDDLRDQRAGRVALWTAETINPGSYL
ncbi:hypothetical protein ACKI1J_15020 [Streptomyces scabiei]|uniref:hypothetical protein n=1 Tax=Streptomyces scabiei TaxID=1930 RepID=UPI0038F731BD